MYFVPLNHAPLVVYLVAMNLVTGVISSLWHTYRFRGSEASSLLLTSTSLGRSSGFFTFISALETCAIFMPMRVVEPLSQLFAFIGALFAGREKISYRRKAYMLSVSVGPLPARRWDQKFWVFYETSSHPCCLPYV